jgi:putative hydrolase of HD superfamily
MPSTSWHLALMVLALAEYSDEEIDVRHTIELVPVHDLVEIDTGDTPLKGSGPPGRSRDAPARAGAGHPMPAAAYLSGPALTRRL